MNLQEIIHKEAMYRFGDCPHGLYTGGPLAGEPWRSCQFYADAIALHLSRTATTEPVMEDLVESLRGALRGLQVSTEEVELAIRQAAKLRDGGGRSE